MKGQRIYYLNPAYADLSIEHESLAGTGFELVPLRVQGEFIDQIADALAIMTHKVPIRPGLALPKRFFRNAKSFRSIFPIPPGESSFHLD